jgi:hypothetical protein
MLVSDKSLVTDELTIAFASEPRFIQVTDTRVVVDSHVATYQTVVCASIFEDTVAVITTFSEYSYSLFVLNASLKTVFEIDLPGLLRRLASIRAWLQCRRGRRKRSLYTIWIPAHSAGELTIYRGSHLRSGILIWWSWARGTGAGSIHWIVTVLIVCTVQVCTIQSSRVLTAF